MSFQDKRIGILIESVLLPIFFLNIDAEILIEIDKLDFCFPLRHLMNLEVVTPVYLMGKGWTTKIQNFFLGPLENWGMKQTIPLKTSVRQMQKITAYQEQKQQKPEKK